MTERYVLPELSYGYKDLEPYMSEAQLRLHHDKHHAGYVKGANAVLEKIESARKENADLDLKCTLNTLTFNRAGHRLHSLFWKNLRKPNEKNAPHGKIAGVLEKEYGGFERFKKEFSQAAVSVEGSGWALLTYCGETGRPIIVPVEKHNVNVPPSAPVLLVIDVWEHAYYLDYKNERARYVEAFWNLVDWDEVERRLKDVLD